MQGTLKDFLGRLSGLLDKAGIPYMVVGSLASGFFGEPRNSYDVDVVIAPSAGQGEDLLALLKDGYYFPEGRAREALRAGGMFNVIDHRTGWKADLILRGRRPFDQTEFDRRRQTSLLDVPLFLCSPEDVILAKLEWAKAGESERQFRDSLRVAVVQRDRLDWAYLRHWARELGVLDFLDRLSAEAAIPPAKTL